MEEGNFLSVAPPQDDSSQTEISAYSLFLFDFVYLTAVENIPTLLEWLEEDSVCLQRATGL